MDPVTFNIAQGGFDLGIFHASWQLLAILVSGAVSFVAGLKIKLK